MTSRLNREVARVAPVSNTPLSHRFFRYCDAPGSRGSDALAFQAHIRQPSVASPAIEAEPKSTQTASVVSGSRSEEGQAWFDRVASRRSLIAWRMVWRARRRSPASSYARASRNQARQSLGANSVAVRRCSNAASAAARSGRPLGRRGRSSTGRPPSAASSRAICCVSSPNWNSRHSAQAPTNGKTMIASPRSTDDGVPSPTSNTPRHPTRPR
jgi:hypothetical protein